MKSLYLTIFFSIAILPFILLRDTMACSPTSPLYTHFVYMFAHASIIHWLCNVWSLLVLHNLFRPARLITAYILSVLLSFLPAVLFTLHSSLFTTLPVLGLSVIVCFFIGFMARHIYHRNRLGLILTLAVIIISCFLPGFAGVYHVVMFALGFIYFPIECFIRRIADYIR